MVDTINYVINLFSTISRAVYVRKNLLNRVRLSPVLNYSVPGNLLRLLQSTIQSLIKHYLGSLVYNTQVVIILNEQVTNINNRIANYHKCIVDAMVLNKLFSVYQLIECNKLPAISTVVQIFAQIIIMQIHNKLFLLKYNIIIFP